MDEDMANDLAVVSGKGDGGEEGGPFDSPFAVIQALEGPALKVFLALLCFRRLGRVMQGFDNLQAHTGLSHNTVRKAVAQLGQYGLVRKNGRYGPLELTGEAIRLSLVQLLLENAPAAQESQNLTVESQTVVLESQNVTLPALTTTTYLHSRESEEAAAGRKRKPKFDPREPNIDPREPKNDSPENAENLAALHEAGIRGTVAEELARLEYVTPEYVRALAGTLREGKDGVGLLVKKIRDGDAMPIHSPGCMCEACDQKRRRKYVTGEFSEFIQH